MITDDLVLRVVSVNRVADFFITQDEFAQSICKRRGSCVGVVYGIAPTWRHRDWNKYHSLTMAEGSTSKKHISNTEKPEEVKNSPKISTKHKRSGKSGVGKESRTMEEPHDHVTVSRGGHRGRQRGYYGNRGRGGHQYKRRYHQEKGNNPPLSSDTPLVDNSSSMDDKINEVPIKKTTPTDNECVIIIHSNKRHSMKPRHQHTNTSTNVNRSSNNKTFNREGGSGYKQQVTLQSNELAQQLTAGTYECMVCCEKVKNRQDIWGCPCCYNLFHLKCISRWARSPAAAINEGEWVSCDYMYYVM